MRKLIILILFLSAFKSFAQTSPVAPVQLTTNSAWYEPNTHRRWFYNGTTYLWWQAVSKAQLDSAVATLPVLSFSSPLVKTGSVVSIPAATSIVNGYLTSTDWNTFNGKVSFSDTTSFLAGLVHKSGFTSQIVAGALIAGNMVGTSAVVSGTGSNIAFLSSSGLKIETGSSSVYTSYEKDNIVFNDIGSFQQRFTPTSGTLAMNSTWELGNTGFAHDTVSSKRYVDSKIPSGGAGTVSSVSIVTANGISGSVATATTTPAITLTLGAITPTSTNGVSAATMAFNDATSSIQTQLNSKLSAATALTTYLTLASPNQTVAQIPTFTNGIIAGASSFSGQSGFNSIIVGPGVLYTTNQQVQGGGALSIGDINGLATININGTSLSGFYQNWVISQTSTNTGDLQFISSHGSSSGSINLSYTNGGDIYDNTGNYFLKSISNRQVLLGAGYSGTPISGVPLQTITTATSIVRGIIFSQYSTDPSGSKVYGYKSRGSYSSPTTIVAGDNVIGFNGAAYDGTQFTDVARMLIASASGSTISSGVVPGTITLQTANASGVLTAGFIQDQSQNVSLPKYTTNGLLKTSAGTGLLVVATSGTDYQAPNSTLTLGTGLTGTSYNGNSAITTVIDQTFTPTWTGLHTFQKSSIGTTPTTAIQLANNTSATIGAQQYAPTLSFLGSGFGTTGSAAQPVVANMYLIPVQGAAAPTSILQLDMLVNGASISNYMFSSAGVFTSNRVTVNRLGLGSTTGAGLIIANGSPATSGGPVQISAFFEQGGQAWDLGTTTSKTFNFKAELLPISGTPATAVENFSMDNGSGTFTKYMSLDNSGNLSLFGGGGFKMNGSSSGTYTQTVPSAITSYTITVPAAAPTSNGQVRSTTTGGVESWASTGINVASNDVTAQTAANTSVATFTTAALGTYRIGGYINITAVTVDVIEMQVTYTDENSTSQTANFFTQGATSALLSAIGNSAFPTMDIRVKTGTAITVKTTLTTGTGSITYDAGATITALR